jgi:hypothetical protein
MVPNRSSLPRYTTSSYIRIPAADDQHRRPAGGAQLIEGKVVEFIAEASDNIFVTRVESNPSLLISLSATERRGTDDSTGTTTGSLKPA